MQHTTRPLVTVLQILVLLAAVARVSSGVAAANSGSDWLKPASEALSVARQTLQSFDPGAGNTEELDPWDRVLGEIRLNAQNCVDARLQAIEKIKGAIKKTYGAKGDEIVQLNFNAVDGTLANLHEVKVPERVTATRNRPPVVSEQAPELVDLLEDFLAHQAHRGGLGAVILELDHIEQRSSG